jgi:hypothetical protein
MSESNIKKAKVVTSYVGSDAKVSPTTTTSVSAPMMDMELSQTDTPITVQSDKDSKKSDVNRGGRPTKYSLEIALKICDRLADGESLVSICRDEGMPKKTAVYEWLATKKDFSDMYARAREDQADSLADQIIALADEMPMEITDEKTKTTRFDSAYVQWQKNRVDARKWVAAKLKPRKYSDRIAHVGDAEADAVKIEVGIFDEMIKNLELKRQVK